MYDALYGATVNGEINPMPAKEKTPAVQDSDNRQFVGYVDRAGNERTEKVTAFQDTDTYRENSSLWPELPQYTQDDILSDNIVLLEMVRMTKHGDTDYGPYFAVHAQSAAKGEFTFLSQGDVVKEWFEKLSGIEVATGRTISDSSLPVECRIVRVNGGEYGSYFNVVPPIGTLTDDS